ncbi:hypothetical protein AB6C56_13100 [Vibrio splendidus]
MDNMLYFLVALNVFKIKFGMLDLTLLAFLITLLYHYKVFGSNKLLYIKKKPLIFSGYTFVIYGYFFLVTFFSEALQFDEILKLIRFFLSFLSICWCVDIIVNKSRNPLFIISRVISLHLILCLVQISFPPVNIFFQQHFLSVGNFHWYRVTGIMNGTSSAGLFLGLCSVFWFYIYQEYKSKFELALVLISVIVFPFTAMTGLAVFIVGIISYILVRKDFGLLLKFTAGFLITSILFSSVYVFADRNNETLNRVGVIEVLYRIDALLGKDSSTRADPRRSAEKLADTYRLPDDGTQIIFGNGYPSKHHLATTTSDAGVVGSIHTYGIIGLILLLISLVLPSIQFLSPLSLGLMSSYLVIFLKNDLTYSRIVFDFYLISIMTLYFYQRKSKLS